MRVPFRGVIVFLLTWAILWTVPVLRGQIVRGLQPQNPNVWIPSLSEQDIASGLKTDPNNGFLQSQQLQLKEWGSTPQGREQFFRGYDALIAQHPADVALRRNRLRFSTRGNIVPAKYQRRFYESYFAGDSADIWLTPNELQDMVTQARLAQKVEPKDGFFPWIEAMALWGLGREDESVAALERAGRCSNFNDGSLEEAGQKMAYLNTIRSLDWDEKIGIQWSALLPHLAGMRVLAKEIGYSGVVRYRAGDRAEAWRRWEIGLRAGRALRESQGHGKSATMTGLLVGEAIEHVAWGIAAEGAANYKPRHPQNGGSTRAGSEERSRESLAAFVRAAKRDGRQALASWVKRDGSEILARRATLFAGNTFTDIFDARIGWKTPLAQATLQLRWVGFYTLLWALIGLAGWILSRVISRRGSHSRVATSTTAMISAFFGALWLGLALLAVVDGAGSQSYSNILSYSGGNESPGRAPWLIDWEGNFWWAIGATLLAIALAREWGAKRQISAEQKRGDATRTRGVNFWKWVGVVAWSLALFLSLVLWFDGRQDVGVDRDALVLGGAWLSCFGVGLVAAWKNQAVQGEQMQALLVGISAAMSLALFVLSGRAHQSDAAGWACLVLCPLTVTLWIWNGRRGLRSWSSLATNLEASGRVLANISLILSVGYLLVSLALYPTRAQLNSRIDEFIQGGEMEWLHTQGK